ncbi:hypothetical protein L3X38_038574 [Prunus dulcis]|uniref:GAG-pre-integrase domain-containing protein n=1 Tax=Prunus dulcis TaxID=3755 RepID=A0AAD4V6T1_PRUDU|nr:hypothetical protein L3X38_038574 [Prunus dulcis]
MTPNVHNLQASAPYHSDDKITMGNGEGLCINHIGSSALPALPGILHLIPYIMSLSLQQIYSLSINSVAITIAGLFLMSITYLCRTNKTNTLMFQGQSNKGLYSIPQFLSPGFKASPTNRLVPFVSNKEHGSSAGVSTSSVCFNPQIKNSVISSGSHALLGQQVKTKLWHLRLGHVTNEVLQHMLKASHISVTPDTTSAICESCLQGKMHKLPFPSSSTISSKPFSKLHSDVWGPSAVLL